MKHKDVILTFRTYWQVIDYPHLKVTKNKRIINTNTNKMLVYNERGFKIGNRHFKRHQMNSILENIPTKKTPW